MTNAIEVRGLTMAYDGHEVVKGIDLEVGRGEIVAFLGPNGSGKTTTIEILEGFRVRTGGEVTVLDQDPATAPRRWYQRIGIVPQESQLTPELTAAELVAMQAGYYRDALAPGEVLSMVGLADDADQRVRKLSGGQQRRVDLALALVGNPELVFLDEPTTGFDPSARRDAWGTIAGLRDGGRTVLLTTHYMEEAEALADRIVMIADGRIVASGTAGRLAADMGSTVSVRWRQSPTSPTPPGELEAVDDGDGAWSITSDDLTADLHRLTGWSLAHDVELVGLSVDRPDLEDVFLSLADGSADTVDTVDSGDGPVGAATGVSATSGRRRRGRRGSEASS